MNTGHAKWTVVLAALVAAATLHEAAAQARRSASGGAAGRGPVAIRKIEALGPASRMRTPIFTTDPGEAVSKPAEWQRVAVRYDTEPDWIDEIEFRYLVLVKNPKTSAYTLFPGAVTYVDVAKGKGHVSTVFLRPQTLERYGPVEWAGVKVFVGGEQVAVGQVPDDPKPWTANVRAVENVLLNRSRTPFALIAVDNYETIKPQ